MFTCGYSIDGKCDYETLDNDFEIDGPITDECIGENECFYYEKWLDKEIEKNKRKYAEEMREKGNKIEEEYIKNTENTFKPNYYKAGNQDVIAFCQHHDIPFDLGTVIKYCTRAGKKKDNSELQDLNKALEFLNRRIEFVKNKGD